MKNLDIRILVSQTGITYKAIAEYMGVTAEYLSRCMARELTPGMKIRIMAAISALSEVKSNGET